MDRRRIRGSTLFTVRRPMNQMHASGSKKNGQYCSCETMKCCIARETAQGVSEYPTVITSQATRLTCLKMVSRSLQWRCSLWSSQRVTTTVTSETSETSEPGESHRSWPLRLLRLLWLFRLVRFLLALLFLSTSSAKFNGDCWIPFRNLFSLFICL